MKKIIVLLVLVMIMPCCKTPQQEQRDDFVCVEHSRHHMNARSEFAECFGFQPEKHGDYFFYNSMENVSQQAHVETAVSRMRSSLEEKIVSFVMKKITRAMGQNVRKNWTFDNMRIPATFRSFVKFDGEKYTVKTIAAMRKRDFTPRGIIMYLPLEYKMHLLQKKKNY